MKKRRQDSQIAHTFNEKRKGRNDEKNCKCSMFNSRECLAASLCNLLCLAMGSRDCTVVRALASHQCDPGSIPGLSAICRLSLLMVLFSTPRGFSPGDPVFPSPQNPTFSNSNSIWMRGHLSTSSLELFGVPWVSTLPLHFLHFGGSGGLSWSVGHDFLVENRVT